MEKNLANTGLEQIFWLLTVSVQRPRCCEAGVAVICSNVNKKAASLMVKELRHNPILAVLRKGAIERAKLFE